MLVNMNSILADANKHHYAVMAMNCINLEMARAGIMAAVEENAPLIIQFGPGQMKKHAHQEEMVPLIKSMANRVHVPIVLNLDHGTDFSVIVDCINNGFTNVMFDGSSLAYEDNLIKTEMICSLAHSVGCSVEGELGHVGQAAHADDLKKDLYTDPKQAKEFVDYTGVDALAVAIGTAHGHYPKGKTPQLDFERLSLLKETLKIPLVLHGGSGAGDENLKSAVKLGINKINVATDAFAVAKKALVDHLTNDPNIDYLHLCMALESSIKKFVKDYMKVIGSSQRYQFGAVNYRGHE